MKKTTVLTLLLFLSSASFIGCEEFSEVEGNILGAYEDGKLVLQAETATLSGAKAASSASGYQGSGYADLEGKKNNSYVEWTFEMSQTETANVAWYYSNDTGSSVSYNISVNGQQAGGSKSLGDTGSWSSWKKASRKISLPKGMVTLRIYAKSDTSDGVNIDRIEITSDNIFEADGGSSSNNSGSSSSSEEDNSSSSSSSSSGTTTNWKNTMEAEKASLNGTFKVGNDSKASGGKYAVATSGNSSSDYIRFSVKMDSAGEYRLRTTVGAKDGSSDSFFVYIDGKPSSGYIYDVARSSGFTDDYLKDRNGADPMQVSLSAGIHTVDFYYREANTKLDKIKFEKVGSSSDNDNSNDNDDNDDDQSDEGENSSGDLNCNISLAVRKAKVEGFGAGVTGGRGGKTVRVSSGKGIHEAMCARASDDTPLIILVDGKVNHGNTAKVSGSCNTTDDSIQFKDVSNISLIGVGNNAVLDQIGIHIVRSSNIIIQNLNIKNVKKSGSPTSNGGDAIGIESNVSKIWVDHCKLEASGGENDGYDSLLDMKAGVTNVTVSYTHYYRSGRGGLIGHNESATGNTNITFHHNIYEDIDSRAPLLRNGTAHMYNNYYVGLAKSGINSRAGGKAKVQNCYFEDSHNPLGTFYTDQPGYWDISGNHFDDSVEWEADDSNQWYPAGPNPRSNASISIPYSASIDPVGCVPALLRANVGVGKI